jgi:hypothetical protein
MSNYRAEERMRDAVRRMEFFTFDEIMQATRLSHVTVDLWLKTFQARGWVTRGKYGRAYLYRYVKPAKGGSRRVKRIPAEKESVDRSAPIQAASGRRYRTGSPLVNDVIRRVSGQGIQVRKRKHRLDFIRDGQVIATSSTTPGASSLKDTESQLRKAGVSI